MSVAELDDDKVTQLRAEREKLNLPADGPNGRSIAERAADDEAVAQEELFPKGTIAGDEKTIKNLIKAGLPVEVTVSMMSAEVPSPHGGLLDPDKEGQYLVTCEVAKYHPIPQREGEPGDKRIVGWKIRQQVRPVYVQSGQFFTREQVLDILHAVGAEGRAEELLGEA